MVFAPINNTALVLKEFRDRMSTLYSLIDDLSSMKFVLDPELTYETATKRIHQLMQKRNKDEPIIPLFAFNRSPLRYYEQKGKRSIKNNVVNCITNDPADGAYQFDTVELEFDINFYVIFNSQRELSNFEITYLSETLVEGSKTLTVDLDDFGQFHYAVEYNQFDDFVYQTETKAHHGLTGTLKITGPYFVMKGEVGLIQRITAEIKSFEDEVYETIIIPE